MRLHTRKAVHSSTPKESTLEWEGEVNGKPVSSVTIKHYPLTRFIRMQALNEAADEYMRRHNIKAGVEADIRPDVATVEKSLVVRLVKSWSLPGYPAQSWEWLDDDLAEMILDAIGVKDMFAEGSKETEVAKN